MPHSASHSSSGLPVEDRQTLPYDLYLKIATQIQHFFQNDLNDLPVETAGKFLRVVVKISQVEPLDWLARQAADIKTYWLDREDKFTMAGVGAIDIVEGNDSIDYPFVFDRIRQYLSPLFPQVRYYGGVGFSQDLAIDSNWQLFGNYRFIVPRFEIYVDGNNTYFACNFRFNWLSENCYAQEQELNLILQELTQLDFTQDREHQGCNLPLVLDRTDSPDRLDWHQNISSALTKFPELNLDKIVLARQSTLTFAAPLQPQSILLALQPYNPLSYHFCFQINPTTAFIGTSPERL